MSFVPLQSCLHVGSRSHKFYFLCGVCEIKLLIMVRCVSLYVFGSEWTACVELTLIPVSGLTGATVCLFLGFVFVSEERFVYFLNWVNRSCLGLIYSLSNPRGVRNSVRFSSSSVNPMKQDFMLLMKFSRRAWDVYTWPVLHHQRERLFWNVGFWPEALLQRRCPWCWLQDLWLASRRELHQQVAVAVRLGAPGCALHYSLWSLTMRWPLLQTPTRALFLQSCSISQHQQHRQTSVHSSSVSETERGRERVEEETEGKAKEDRQKRETGRD